MTHLSSSSSIMAMIFYSFLTFFLGPYLVGLVLKDNPHVNIIGFNVGFAISMGLWIKFGKNYVTQ